MLRLFLITGFLYCILPINAQNSYNLHGNQTVRGSSLIQEINDDIYWVFDAIANPQTQQGNDLIHVTEFDQCGPLRSFEFSLDGAYGVNYFNEAHLDGDSLKISMSFNARTVDHDHNEIGFISININDLGHEYHYLRGDNVVRVLSFFPTQNNKYFVHAFMSYVDRPIQYCSFILNENFEVERYYENYGWGVITGDALEVEGGYFVATAKYIYKLDYDLNPIWSKFMPGYMYARDLYLEPDGVVMRSTQTVYDPIWERVVHAIKLDFESNLIWQSENLDFDDQEERIHRLQKNQENNYEMVVQKSTYPENSLNRDLVIFTIDGSNGNIIKTETGFNSTFLDSFQFYSYKILDDNQRVLFVRDKDLSSYLWNVSTFMDCNLENGSVSSKPKVPFIARDTFITPSKVDSVYTGSYPLQFSMSQAQPEIVCSATAELIKQLPSDTLICEELGLTLDLTAIPYGIIWEDGSTEKIRQINVAGQYSYEVDHCDIEFEESFIATSQKCACQYYLPNAFSPNGDLVNDHFYAHNPCELASQFELSVFDRWGNMVFYSEDQNEQWDGTYNGKETDTGLFTVLLKYTSDIIDEEFVQSTQVTLIR